MLWDADDSVRRTGAKESAGDELTAGFRRPEVVDCSKLVKTTLPETALPISAEFMLVAYYRFRNYAKPGRPRITRRVGTMLLCESRPVISTARFPLYPGESTFFAVF